VENTENEIMQEVAEQVMWLRVAFRFAMGLLLLSLLAIGSCLW